jgi:hypothetical protein
MLDPTITQNGALYMAQHDFATDYKIPRRTMAGTKRKKIALRSTAHVR